MWGFWLFSRWGMTSLDLKHRRPSNTCDHIHVTVHMYSSNTSVFLSVLFSNHWKTKLYLITWIRYTLLQFILPFAGVVMLCPTTQISHSISLKGGASFFPPHRTVNLTQITLSLNVKVTFMSDTDAEGRQEEVTCSWQGDTFTLWNPKHTKCSSAHTTSLFPTPRMKARLHVHSDAWVLFTVNRCGRISAEQ